MAAADAVLSDPDLVLLVLKQCTSRGLGRAARICRSWRDHIQGKLDKAELRRWCIAASSNGSTNGGCSYGYGLNGNMYQVRVKEVLLLERPHCMAMHAQLNLPERSCGAGYPMPATFDLLMGESPTAVRRTLFQKLAHTPFFMGRPVEPGWAAFVRRANKQAEHEMAQRLLARASAHKSHLASLEKVAKRRRQQAATATDACMRAMQARLIETQQPLPETNAAVPGLLQTAQPFSQDHEAAVTQLKLQLEAAAKALGQVLESNARLKQPTFKQGPWYMDRASRCTCDCVACKSVR